MSKLHLAGIIPIAGLNTEFEIATPEVLLPISADFVAVQKSVFECAMAGCSTIWIVANDDLAPIVKAVVGEWTYDPVYFERMSAFSSEHQYTRRTVLGAIHMGGQYFMEHIRLGRWRVKYQVG